MARVVIAITAACLAAAAAGAMSCSIVSSFWSPAHGQQICGLDYYNGHLYHAGTMMPGWFYESDLTGSIISSFAPPTGAGYIEVDSAGIWMVSRSPTETVFLLTATGSITASYPLSFDSGGFTRQGNDVWWFTVNTSGKDWVYKTTTSGSVITSFPSLGTTLHDLDFDGEYLWLPEAPLQHPSTGIYKYTTSGSLVDYVQPFPGTGRPGGVCWDGAYLWAVDIDAPGYCYKMLCTPNPAVAPASFGKVKALFR